MSKVVEGGNEIARSNQLFMEVRRVGELDAKGKILFARGFKGKFTALPDAPLTSLIAAIADQFIIRGFAYSSVDAARKDLEAFKMWAESLSLERDSSSQGQATESKGESQ